MAFDKADSDGSVDTRAADGRTGGGRATKQSRPVLYLLTICGLAVVGLAAIFVANRCFAPEMYLSRAAHVIGKTLAGGDNYAVFDLNVNIRAIRSAQIAKLNAAPDVALIGASHWQEAHGDLMPNARFLNVHVHRDYYEDLLAMSEVLVRNDKLPRTMVIAFRDAIFSPIEERRDHLWLPAVADYRAMSARLNIEPHSTFATLPVARLREQISMPMLFNNVTRWYNADLLPGATQHRAFSSLDTLLPDGSITWSRQHRAQFTAERSRKLALAAAVFQSSRPHGIDPKGVEAVDALLGFLTMKGVDVVIAFPPFNPVFFDKVRDTPFMPGLRRLEAVSRGLAGKHGLRVIGSFDPADLGCTAAMFIDAEHSNPLCLSRILEQLGTGSTAPKSLVLSEAETPLPINDLARQQLLILQNGRAQASLVATPETPKVDVIVAAAAPPPAETDAVRPLTPPARIVRTSAPHQRRTVTQTETDGDREPAPKMRSRFVRPEPAPARRRDLQQHEFVWPGDLAPAAGLRRSQHSSANH